MKFLKKIGVLLLTLASVVLIVALFVPNSYHVSRTISIERSKTEVFNYLLKLEHQKAYGVWLQKDPDAKHSISGIDGTIGAIQAWDSQHEEVGQGEQEIIAIDQDVRIDYELRFIRPRELTAEAYFTTRTAQNGTDVTWGFEGEASYPWNFFFLFMDMDAELGPDLQQGLDQLKVVLESEE